MQHLEILLCFSGPVELLLVQIPFPTVFCLPILVANCRLTVAPSLLGAWAGVASQLCPPQCRVPCPRVVAVPGAISGDMWHLPQAAGRHQGAPSSPSCSRELGCEPALYRQRVLGRFQRCWSRDGHPSLHPGSTAPLHVLTALPHFRAAPPPHPQCHIRACPEGPVPAINQPGLPLPHPCGTALPEQPSCRIFPVHPPLPLAKRWIRSWSPDVLLVRSMRDGAWAEREWLGTMWGLRPPCAGISSAAGAHPGSILTLADPPWLLVGLWDPLGYAPGAADFLCLCHVPGFDSFHLLPALPPSSISSASVTALWQLNSMEP